MTEQEAIEQLNRISKKLGSIGEKVDHTDIAIEALEFYSKYKDIVDCFIKRVEEKDGEPLKGFRILTNEDAIKYDEIRKENEQLKTRCAALTHGQICLFCPLECEHRTCSFRGKVK